MSCTQSVLLIINCTFTYHLCEKCASTFVFYLVFRYYETISEVLRSVKKMEESLKRLKQARKGAAATSTTGANGGPSDDSKIRLQLVLDVEYLGEQVCQTNRNAL